VLHNLIKELQYSRIEVNEEESREEAGNHFTIGTKQAQVSQFQNP